MAKGAGDMSALAVPLADVAGDFGDAIDFIFHQRESVSGGIQVGGPNELFHLGVTHMKISLLAIAAACLVSIPIGLYLGHIGRGEFLAISISNIGRAVPSLALLAFFIAYIGLGTANIVLVLFLLAVPPILTNTYVATRQVDRNTVDAARGQGMSEAQIVRKVELPLGIATIFGGIRTSTVNVVATATIAPLASVKTLGFPIINGNVYGFSGTLGAAIVVAVLTLVLDGLLAVVQRSVTPKGIKLRSGSAPGRGKFFAIRTPRGEQV
ncbi:MAG: osmoprotectant transport system substrate-binding protein opuBD [Thermoleophilaceae bacterium]|nr:osmoprotectant transport system substrate-binding protein opuBD [Thermoleophilaceae bacterium]